MGLSLFTSPNSSFKLNLASTKSTTSCFIIRQLKLSKISTLFPILQFSSFLAWSALIAPQVPISMKNFVFLSVLLAMQLAEINTQDMFVKNVISANY